jgi:hypothetical protein
LVEASVSGWLVGRLAPPAKESFVLEVDLPLEDQPKQGDQTSLLKNTQNLAQPIFVKINA